MIGPHDYMAELFNAMKQFNVILMDCDKDVWGYVNRLQGLVRLDLLLCLISCLFRAGRAFKVPYTDSTVLRNMGVGLGHSLLAYRSSLQGIGKLQVFCCGLCGESSPTHGETTFKHK
ncbi:hypothetical protein MKX01_019874 [Papaver californicum]|nr:hypothetical protein MKX01_019874 [Papaver californicum]